MISSRAREPDVQSTDTDRVSPETNLQFLPASGPQYVPPTRYVLSAAVTGNVGQKWMVRLHHFSRSWQPWGSLPAGLFQVGLNQSRYRSTRLANGFLFFFSTHVVGGLYHYYPIPTDSPEK